MFSIWIVNFLQFHRICNHILFRLVWNSIATPIKAKNTLCGLRHTVNDYLGFEFVSKALLNTNVGFRYQKYNNCSMFAFIDKPTFLKRFESYKWSELCSNQRKIHATIMHRRRLVSCLMFQMTFLPNQFTFHYAIYFKSILIQKGINFEA